MLKNIISPQVSGPVNNIFLRHKFFPVLWQTLKRFENKERRRDAAALTYTTLFALVPMLTVIYAILSAMPSINEWSGEALNNKMLTYLLPEGSEQISEYLLAFSQQAKSLTWIGAVFLLVTSLMLLRTVEIQFNRIWKVDEPRSGIQTFLRYWAVLTLGPLFIISALTLSSILASMPIVSDLERAPLLLRLLPWVINAFALSAMYILVPNCRVPWKNAVMAALLIAAVLEIGKIAFTQFIGMFPSYKLIYGAFAAVPLFLLWMYLAWMMLLFGAELSYGLSHYAPGSRKMPIVWRRLLLIHLLIEKQQKGHLLTEAQLTKRLKNLTPVQVRVELQRLHQKKYVSLTQEGKWVWLPNPQQLTLAELFEELSLSDLSAPIPSEINLSNALQKHWREWQQEWLSHSKISLDRSVASVLSCAKLGV